MLELEVDVGAADAAAAVVWRLSSQAPAGITRESWPSRPSQAVRPDAADVIAARCPCSRLASAAVTVAAVVALRDLGLEPVEGRLPVAHVGARLHEGEPEDDRDAPRARRPPRPRSPWSSGHGSGRRPGAFRRGAAGSRLTARISDLDSKSDCHGKRREVVA